MGRPRAVLRLLASAAALSGAAADAAELPKLGFGGQLRLRGEAAGIEAYSPAAKRRQQDQLLLRTRLSVDADAGRGIKAFAQIQDSRVSGSEASVSANSANVDLHQGWLDVLELNGWPLDLRAGRMELQYGDMRFVSPLDWSNVGRAWDGLRLRLRGERHTEDLFVTQIKEVGGLKDDQLFWGFYGSCRAVPGHETDLYLLGRDLGDGSQTNEHGTKGNLSERTAGTRVKGAAGHWDYTAEAAWQFGRKAGQVVRAWGAAVTGGHTLDGPWRPRLGAEYDFASGDADPSDNKLQTLDPLFPFGHAYQGHQDLFSWRNGHALKGSLSADPAAGWRVQADFHHFRLAHSKDAWYDAAMNVVARDATGASGKDIGSELDLHVRGKFRDRIALWFGYSHFFAGGFVRSAAARQDRDWAFFQATLDF